jgi:hypothetical protein
VPTNNALVLTAMKAKNGVRAPDVTTSGATTTCSAGAAAITVHEKLDSTDRTPAVGRGGPAFKGQRKGVTTTMRAQRKRRCQGTETSRFWYADNCRTLADHPGSQHVVRCGQAGEGERGIRVVG